MTGKFTTLDDAILAAIKAGRTTFVSIVGNVEDLAKHLATPDRWGKISHDRLVDRRLQALRKQGKIAYKAKQWFLPQ